MHSPFWWGCGDLFGLDPQRIGRLAARNERLALLGRLPVPRVLRAGTVAGRPCVVVEHLPGERLHDLRALPPAALVDLGVAIARIHLRQFAWWGEPVVAGRAPLAAFHPHMAATMRAVAGRFYAHDAVITAALDGACAQAAQLPDPDIAALVMLDIDATQFLTDGNRITALVDTDAYVVAPRELDFIGYEYEFDAASAAAFAAGYRAVAPLPDLTRARPVYRYFYRLLATQGPVPLDEWMAWPAFFS